MPQVQNQLAVAEVSQFGNAQLSISLVCKGQDWNTRQKTAYESMKDFIRQEFHGLADFKQQMELYSNALGTSGKIAWKVIKSLVPNNAQVLTTELKIVGMGMVGKFLLSIPGFAQLFAMVPQALSEVKQAKSILSSASGSGGCNNTPLAG